MDKFLEILSSAGFFLILIGVVVFVHELGHFLLARAVGVTVVKFSLGFGPRVFGFTRKGTEFLVSAVPLGGYCKFLGDDPEKPLAAEERHKGFLTTEIWRRTLIVLAGPVFNLILPLLVAFPIMLSHTTLEPAVLGSVSVGGPAWEAGLRPGDKLVAIDDRPVSYWIDMQRIVSGNPGTKLEIAVKRPAPDGKSSESKKFTVKTAINDDPVFKAIGFRKKTGSLDVTTARPRVMLGVAPGSAAEKAGFKPFDAVVDIDGQMVWTWNELQRFVSARVGGEIKVTVNRPATGAGNDVQKPIRQLITLSVPADMTAFGLSDAGMEVADVTEGSPAARAGVRKGDRITALDGRAFGEPGMMMSIMARKQDVDHVLTVARPEGPVNLTINLKNPEWEPGTSRPSYLASGMQFRADYWTAGKIPNNHLVSYAFRQTWIHVSNMFVSSVASLGAVATGRVSFKELGGPIMIFTLAGQAGEQGVIPFLFTMMFISIGLGIMNLLPVPLLDGGHLVLFGWEKIRGRAPTMAERNVWSWIGLILLLLLMALVVKNDIFRLIS